MLRDLKVLLHVKTLKIEPGRSIKVSTNISCYFSLCLCCTLISDLSTLICTTCVMQKLLKNEKWKILGEHVEQAQIVPKNVKVPAFLLNLKC